MPVENNTAAMKALNLTAILFILCLSNPDTLAQNDGINRCIPLTLKDIPVKTPERQTYEITVKRQGTDPLDGKKLFADAARAASRGLKGDAIRGDEGHSAALAKLQQERAGGTPFPCQANYTYPAGTFPFLQEDFYNRIPAESLDWTLMLLTDAVMLHEYKLGVLDSLEFGRPYHPETMKNNDITLSSLEFNFSSDYLRYLWDGVTRHNGRLCAVVRFESFFNRMSNRWANGRSMYYG